VSETLKRHVALQPLSRHHHHALVLALRLKRIGISASSDTVAGLCEDVVRFWETGGQAHFREEEEVLWPTYAQYARLDRPEIAESLLDHVRIRGRILQIARLAAANAAEADLLPPLHELGDWLDVHVRTEERVLFPLIETVIPKEVLDGLAGSLSIHMPSVCNRVPWVKPTLK